MRDIGNEVIVLAQREYSTMSSTWMEYLTLTKGQEHRYLIASASYDALAEANEYFNEEKDDYEIPTEINGKKVIGVEDGYIIGGELGINMDYSGLEFDDPKDPGLKAWLELYNWNDTVTINDIRKVLRWGGAGSS